MEILKYTKEHNEFRERLRSFFAKEVTPFVDEWEKDKIVPKSVWRKMGKEGFLCTNISKDYGGLGGDFIYSLIVSEEMVKTNHSGISASMHSDIIVPYIEAFGLETQKKKYLPGCVSGDIITAIAMTEPNTGSDISAITTTAVEDGDVVVINGSKTFISNGINCDLLIIAAKDPLIDDPYQALSLYLIEDGTPGFDRGNQLEKMGMHSQDTAELFFNNCRVPIKNRLGEKGSGFMMLMQKLQPERLVVAMIAVPAAEQILELTIDFCKKTPGENGKPLSKSQATSFALVEMSTEVKLGRTFLDKLIADHMEGKNVIIETSMAKYWTTDMLKRISNRCLGLYGNYGSLESCPIARGWRDVQVTSIFAGTNEIMKVIAAKFMGL